jgi:hypothetical protein
MGYTSKNPRFETELLTNQGATSISNAPSGTHRLINRNGVIYVQDSSGVETAIGSSGLDAPLDLKNYTLTASVGASALTISLKSKAGTNPSSTDPSVFGFRSTTATNGTYSVVQATAATSVTVSSGSTLGHASGVASYIYVYVINNAGTVELAVSTTNYGDNKIISTTAEGGAGAADSASVIYSTTSRSNVAARLIGRMISTQTTAGTWAAVPSEISLGNNFVFNNKIVAIRLDTDITSTTAGILQVNGLTTGRVYKIHVVGKVLLQNTGVSSVSLAIIHNSVNCGNLFFNVNGNAAIDQGAGITAIITAAASTVTVNATISSATVVSSTTGTRDATYMIVEEINNSDFTSSNTNSGTF